MFRLSLFLAIIGLCLVAAAAGHKGKDTSDSGSNSGSGCTDCTKKYNDSVKNSPYLGPHRDVRSSDCQDCGDRHYTHNDDANLRQWISGDIDAVGGLTIDEDGTKHFASVEDAKKDTDDDDDDDDDDDSFIQKASKTHITSRAAATLKAQAALEVAQRAKRMADLALEAVHESADSDSGECKSCTQKKIEQDHADTEHIQDHAHNVDSTDCENCADGENYNGEDNANQSLWTTGDIDKVGDLQIAPDGTKTFLNPIEDNKKDEE